MRLCYTNLASTIASSPQFLRVKTTRAGFARLVLCGHGARMENSTRTLLIAALLAGSCTEPRTTPAAEVPPAAAPAAAAAPTSAPQQVGSDAVGVGTTEKAAPAALAGRRYAIDYAAIKMATSHFIDFCPGDVAVDNKDDHPTRGKYEVHDGVVTVRTDRGESSLLRISDDGRSLTDVEAPPLPRHKRVFKEAGAASCEG